jgi:membrane protease YdiL (CAAX protease family)
MPSFFTLRYRPTSETLRAGTLVFCFILVLGSTANLVPDRFFRPASIAVAIFYVAIYFASLPFARRQQSFASLGITGGHWLIAVIVGIILGSVGVLGVAQDFPGGTFIPTVGWLSILTLVCTGAYAGFVEAVVFYGYFQFRLRDAFGAPIAIIGTAFAWMVLHAVVISVPGAGTFSAQRGVASFLIGIFAGFLMICIVVQLTRSLWAGALANMIANVFVNLYMLSVKPQQVIIADPKDLPIDGLAFILVIMGIFLTRQRIKSEQSNPGDPQSRSD